MKRFVFAGLLGICLSAQPALAQANDFVAGRLFQIALENAPEFTASGTPTFGTLATGQTETFNQTLVAGTCYMWLAVGDTGLTDLDLSVSVGGVPVAGDDAPDDWPIMQYCSATATEARIDLLMYAGAGAYGFDTYSRYFGGADQIELNMNFYSTIFAPDAVPQGPITRATLATAGEQTFVVPMSAGRCYTIIGASTPGVSDLDFFLLDPTGQTIDSDEALDSYPVVGVCPTTNGNFTLRTVMYSGSGEFGWQMFAFQPF